MDIHFNDTQPANASAETLFDVITDYPDYPRFNSAVVDVKVVEMKPFLKRIFYGINFTPFIEEAERRQGKAARGRAGDPLLARAMSFAPAGGLDWRTQPTGGRPWPRRRPEPASLRWAP